jgi:hypothetical protein
LGLFSALAALVAAAVAACGDFGGLLSVILNTLLGLFSALVGAAVAACGDFGGLLSLILNIREGLEELGDFVFNSILNVV